MENKTALGLDTRLGSLICYVGNFICSFGLIYSIIVIVTDKTNKLVRFHAFQSVLCSACGLIFGLFIGIGAALAVIVDSQIGFPLLSLGIGLVGIVLGLVFFVFFVKATINAYRGEILDAICDTDDVLAKNPQHPGALRLRHELAGYEFDTSS